MEVDQFSFEPQMLFMNQFLTVVNIPPNISKAGMEGIKSKYSLKMMQNFIWVSQMKDSIVKLNFLIKNRHRIYTELAQV